MNKKEQKRIQTKQRILEAARDVFAKHNKNTATMQDIAEYAGLGRRTLYSYFNDKEDVYMAVVERELSTITTRLEAVVGHKISAVHKLELYIFTRLNAIKEVVFRNGSLEAGYFQNVMELEHIRMPMDIKEIKMLRQIIEEGVSEKLFKPCSSQWTAMMILYALKGFELPYLNSQVSKYMQDKRGEIMDFLFNGFLRRHDNGQTQTK